MMYGQLVYGVHIVYIQYIHNPSLNGYLGTGIYYEARSDITTLPLSLLVNQLIASTTDTEDVHMLLRDFLPREKYYRYGLWSVYRVLCTVYGNECVGFMGYGVWCTTMML